jgi:Fibronectin type III domain
MARITLGLVVILSTAVVSVQAVPGPPSGLAATVTGTTVVLNWVAPSGATLIGYRIEAGSAATLSNLASIVVGVTPTFTATAVPAGTYFVRVRAIAADGEGPPSNEIVVVVGGPTGCVPNAPTAFAASVQGDSVALTWAAPVGGCAPTGYVLQAGSGPTASDLAALPVAGTSFSTGAPPGRYYARVVAVNAFGSSPPSNELIIAVGGIAPGTVNIVESSRAILVGPGDTAIIVGEVRNESPQSALFVRVNIQLLGAGGAPLGTASTFLLGQSRRVLPSGIIDASALAPGALGCFYLPTTVPVAAISRVNSSLSFERLDNIPMRSFVSFANPTGIRTGGQMRVTGAVLNRGPILTYLNTAILYLQEAGGAAVGCDFAEVAGSPVQLPTGTITNTGLAPGQVGGFDKVTHAPANATQVRGWVQWAEEGGAVAVGDPLAERAEATYAFINRVGETDEGRRDANDAYNALQAERREVALRPR